MNRKTQFNRLIIAAIAPFLVMGSAISLQAQTPSEENPSSPFTEYRYFIQLNKAKNLARQAAEKANGGLSQYRAESSMHGSPAETNHLQIAEGVWKFTFKGKRPQANNYSIEYEGYRNSRRLG